MQTCHIILKISKKKQISIFVKRAVELKTLRETLRFHGTQIEVVFYEGVMATHEKNYKQSILKGIFDKMLTFIKDDDFPL